MPHPFRAAALTLLVAACGHGAQPARPTPAAAPTVILSRSEAQAKDRPAQRTLLPAIPRVDGPLTLHVIYPQPGSTVDVRDSSFVFGNTGTGDARVTVNGTEIPVAPNGTWLAWIPFPPDQQFTLQVAARTATDSASVAIPLKRPLRYTPPETGLWVDSLSLAPRGRMWVRATDDVALSVRAAPGSQVRLRLPDGGVVPLTTVTEAEEVPAGVLAFDRDTVNLRRGVRTDRYVGVLRGRAVGADPGLVVGEGGKAGGREGGMGGKDGQDGKDGKDGKDGRVPPRHPERSEGSLGPVLEAILGPDTVRTPWPLQLALLDTLPTVVEFNDDTLGLGTTDSLTIGRARPAATYHWFFPTGTRATVIGRHDADLHVRLSETSSAWIPAADARRLPTGVPRPMATAGSVTLSPLTSYLRIRIPLSQRIPFQVEERANGLSVVLYSTSADVNWMRYGGADPLLASMDFHQRTGDEVVLDFTLSQPLWGWRTYFTASGLVLELRRPPVIDKDHPFRGRTIVVDPGHPPAGATGPTGMREAEANLNVALRLAPMLEAAGAKVILTRDRDTSIDLLPRVKLAERADADLLISIHNNALPDGLNPYTNNGTSVFYNHLPSIPLAMAVDRALVARLGLRDLGVARGDLALVRGTWVPSILTEGLFMMIPEQEAALRSDEGQRRYAEGVLAGVETFLRARARDTTGREAP